MEVHGLSNSLGGYFVRGVAVITPAIVGLSESYLRDFIHVP